MIVYCLHHKHRFENGEVDDKIIGYFSSEKKANRIKREYMVLPGFCDFKDDFSVEILKMKKCKKVYELYFARFDDDAEIEIMLGRYSSRKKMRKDYEMIQGIQYFGTNKQWLYKNTNRIDVDIEWEEGFTTD